MKNVSGVVQGREGVKKVKKLGAIEIAKTI